jgi:SAM-dependent methyltransferase
MPLSALRPQPDPAAADSWFASDAGRALLGSETELVAEAARSRLGPAVLWFGPSMATPPRDAEGGLPLCLHGAADGFHGDLRCGLPLPLASETCAVVIVQHLGDAGGDPAALLAECERVLVPGGWLWLLALNPLSPYRWRWRGQGLEAREPVTWRRRLRAAGLVPDSVTQGVGPTWERIPHARQQDGVGLRAAFLLRAEKRRLPLTPLRRPRALALGAGTPA